MQHTACSCGSTSFDLTTTAMLTLDIAREPQDATATLDGFHKDPNGITITCRDCGQDPVLTDPRHKATVIALIRQEKRLGARLTDFASFTFEDGTVVVPDEITEPALRDVTAGPAYQAARKHLEAYVHFIETQTARIVTGEIKDADLDVMRITWRQAGERHLSALVAELTS